MKVENGKWKDESGKWKVENGKSKQWQNECFAVEVARKCKNKRRREDLDCCSRLGSDKKSLELVHRDIFGRALSLSCSLGALPGACFCLLTSPFLISLFQGHELPVF